MKKGRFVGYFINNQQSAFYQSDNFTKVLQYVQTRPKDCKMKEKQTRNGLRLLLTFEQIKSVKQALAVLETIIN